MAHEARSKGRPVTAADASALAPGLRERKKARTRAEIQRQALRLFRERGYEATPISQIAEAADVSESTLFRYFPTKEGIVLQDEFDEPLVAALAAQPPHLDPVRAMRAAVREVFGELPPDARSELRERAELILRVPQLREAVAGALISAIDQTSDVLAGRMGHGRDDLAVRTLAGAIIGGMMGAWVTATEDPSADFVELMDAALGHLETSLST